MEAVVMIQEVKSLTICNHLLIVITRQSRGSVRPIWGNPTGDPDQLTHSWLSTLHSPATLPPFFHLSGFLGLPPVSQGCLSIGGRGILIGKRQPASSKSPSFIASTRNLSLYWGNYTNRLCDLSGSFQCNQFFSIPLISPKSPKDQVIHL